MTEITIRITKTRIAVVLAIILAVILKNAYAKEIVSQQDFHTFLASGGDTRTYMDTSNRMEVDYLKVVIKTNKGEGDKYDVRFKYSKDLLQSKKTIAVKKGLTAQGKTSTVYFIPEKGECPGKKSQCVRVPVIEGISTKDKLIDSTETIYGIEVYNGSAFGWLMEVTGTYYFVKK